jgi:hypothetical protein
MMMATITNSRLRRGAGGAVAAGALALAIVGLAGSGAQAATPTAHRSCSLDLGTGTTVCVPAGQDLNAAVLTQAHLRVVVPGGAVGRTTSAVAVAESVQTVYVQAQLYSYSNYGGAMFQVTNSSACNGSTVYQLTDLANYGFDNDTDSFRSFNNCSTKLWDGANLSGTSYGYYVNSTYVGDAMVNRASSLQIR